MKRKNSCKVCGSKRQRNLRKISVLHQKWGDAIPFLYRMMGGELLDFEDYYICYRCSINPDSALILRSHGKKGYRYQDTDEKVEANRLRRDR